MFQRRQWWFNRDFNRIGDGMTDNFRGKAVFFLMLLSLIGTRIAPGASLPPPDDALIQILKYNEQAITTYQGRVTQTEYRVVERNDDRKYLKPYAEPLTVRVAQTDFIHDRSRGEDFRATMTHSSDLFAFETPVITIRRSGDYIESLGRTKNLDPKLGIIPELKDSLYLGHEPRNLDTRSSIHILSTAYEEGFTRISPSQCMSNSDYVWPCGEEEVEGHKCRKYAMQVRSGDQSYVAFVWFGSDINYNIVKQQITSLHNDMYLPFSEWAKHDDVERSLAYFETARPIHLTVNSDYIKTPNGIWVPKASKAYIIGTLNEDKVADMADYPDLIKVTERDPHASKFKSGVFEAFHTWQLDMESLKLNELIDPCVFEESVIPEGVPVSNFRLDIHPKDIERIAITEDLLNDTEPTGQGNVSTTEESPSDMPDPEKAADGGGAGTSDDATDPEPNRAANQRLNRPGSAGLTLALVVLIVAVAAAGVLFLTAKRTNRNT